MQLLRHINASYSAGFSDTSTEALPPSLEISAWANTRLMLIVLIGLRSTDLITVASVSILVITMSLMVCLFYNA